MSIMRRHLTRYGLVLLGTAAIAACDYQGAQPRVPYYTLTLSSPALIIAQGASTPTTTVNIARTNFPGGVMFSVDNLPAGVTAAFAPNNTTANASVLTLTVAGNAPTGTFTNLLVRGGTIGFDLADRTAPLTVTVAAACNNPVVISDDFETDKNWMHTPNLPPLFSATYDLQTSGGNGGGYAKMTHTEVGPGDMSVLHVLQVPYDPGQPNNAITRINYSEDQIELNPPFTGAAIGTGFVIMQNGVPFTKVIGTGAFINTVWLPATLSNLTEASFPGINFSGGGVLTFGFLRSNSSLGGTTTTTHGIDNFRVEICR